MQTQPVTQNLNSRLSVAPRKTTPSSGIGVSWSATAIRSSSPPVRIVGSSSRYRGGGYRVNF